MAFETFTSFFKPTLPKAAGMLAVGVSLLAHAASSETSARASYLAGYALTGNAFFYIGYVALSALEPHLPAFLRPAPSGPAT
jgi:hypothetical protein